MLVVVFDSVIKAYEGYRALSELHADGTIVVYAVGVIAKDSKGTVTVKQAVDQGPLGSVLSMATGSLVGLLGGPLGVAVGTIGSTLGGSMSDLANAGIGAHFVDEVSRQFLPGKSAVIAEVDEEWVIPVDTRMEALGGVVFRCARSEVVDAHVERVATALRAEIERLEAELTRTRGEARFKLATDIEIARTSPGHEKLG
ncbi:MAG TPA: DUF1269 domain-containing protein [Candidatus Binatia bacterium]|jgi:uncharacterized membrane protein